MPSGPKHWHELWKNDVWPVDYLTSRGFQFERGIISIPAGGPDPDELDLAAIAYLCAEWDYGYEPTKVKCHSFGAEGVEDHVWTKPEYVAADKAYTSAILNDSNDRMSALATAVDAAVWVVLEQARESVKWYFFARPAVRLHTSLRKQCRPKPVGSEALPPSPTPTMAEDPAHGARIWADVLAEVEAWRQREVQALGAALSRRNWHEMETAYNELRDKMDRHLGTPDNGVEPC